MFTTLLINIGGREHHRFFQDFTNAEKAYFKEASDRIKAGWTILKNVNAPNVAKGWQDIYLEGKTDKGEKFTIALIDTYFEDESSKGKLAEEKIEWLTAYHHNLFQAGLIQRAIFDDNISVEKFEQGYKEIEQSEDRDEDEFAPDWFEED